MNSRARQKDVSWLCQLVCSCLAFSFQWGYAADPIALWAHAMKEYPSKLNRQRFRQKALERRRARNAARKAKAEDAFVFRWPRNYPHPILQPPRPSRYTGIARYYRIKSKIRDRARRNRPQRITALIEAPLIQYQRFRRGETLQVFDFLEKHYSDPVSFWIYWLKQVQDAVGRRPQRELIAPIRDLARLLEDLRAGTKSTLTDQFFEARHIRKKGRRHDPIPVAQHKQSVGLCYKVLMGAALNSQSRAIDTLVSCMEKLGLKRPILGDIAELAKKVAT